MKSGRGAKCTDRSLDVLSKVVENRPELSPVQLPAVVVVVLVEERPQQLLQATHHPLGQDKVALVEMYAHRTQKQDVWIENRCMLSNIEEHTAHTPLRTCKNGPHHICRGKLSYVIRVEFEKSLLSKLPDSPRPWSDSLHRLVDARQPS